MKPLRPGTLARLNRAFAVALWAFVILVVLDRIGYSGKYEHFGSGAAWTQIARHLDHHVFVSLIAGVLAYFWPAGWRW
jgi:ABC-type Fe3+ transport system permease subunit